MRCVVVAMLIASAPAAAEPLPLRFAEQAPPLGPRTVRVATDTAIVTDAGGDARSATVTVEALGRRGGWVYGLQLGSIGWSDRYPVISDHRSTGWQPTNPILTAAFWFAPGRDAQAPDARVRIGVHAAAMLGITGGVACDCDGSYEYEKRPSQIARFTAVPYTVPDEDAGQFGVVARYDDGRVTAQAEAALVGILGKRRHSDDTPNHGWFAGGVGLRVSPDLALVAHAFIHRGKQIYEDYEHRFAVGGAVQYSHAAHNVALRVDQRLDACEVGAWFPDDSTGTCTRVVVDYARSF